MRWQRPTSALTHVRFAHRNQPQPREGDSEDLALLLHLIARRLPSQLLLTLLQRLPRVEVARLACVHKAYLGAWQQLRASKPAGC